MKGQCWLIAVIGVILGIVSTIYGVYQVHNSPLATLITLAAGGVITYMMFVPWATFAEILERLENLEWQLKNTTTGIEQETKSIFSEVRSFSGVSWTDGAEDWRCPQCGAINAGYVGTCKVGPTDRETCPGGIRKSSQGSL